MFVRTRMCVFVCACVRVRVCVCVCVRARARVYECMCACVSVHVARVNAQPHSSCTSVCRHACVQARVQHWAMAGLVLIEGATGSNSGIINGSFEVAERPDNEPPIYRRADGRDGWLFVGSDGKWEVGPMKDKDARKTWSTCCAHSVEQAQERLPNEVGAGWKVYDNGKWTEQQLRVLHVN